MDAWYYYNNYLATWDVKFLDEKLLNNKYNAIGAYKSRGGQVPFASSSPMPMSFCRVALYTSVTKN